MQHFYPRGNCNEELTNFLAVFPDVWTGTNRESRRGSNHKSYDWPLRELGSFTSRHLVSSGSNLGNFYQFSDSSGQNLARFDQFWIKTGRALGSFTHQEIFQQRKHENELGTTKYATGRSRAKTINNNAMKEERSSARPSSLTISLVRRSDRIESDALHAEHTG
ncbi:PREDICTED: uncharacterized protein LOC108758525 [Trachymyrmex cornetzi]|uniref:uncharacterized protein LOC108758525 n=1 Tax=Trachymyrmex cornetzi TaxID=471704 RepID=UPI00084F553D|nr:PREDICTED: uncharacterized protein LOC108758525 [Trachymyrmex cornetzi]